MSVPLSAYCTPQGNIILLRVSNESVRNEQEITEHSVQQKADIDFKQDIINVMFIDHDYFKQNNWCLTEYADEVIIHI